MKYAALPVHAPVDERISALRADALSRGIPVADEETLNFLLLQLAAVRPSGILEIGTAVGLSAAAMLGCCPQAHLVTIEVEEDRWREAKKNLKTLGFSDRATCYLGDAGEILAMMNGTFDFVFLDGPKAQYEKYLFDLKRLLRPGGKIALIWNTKDPAHPLMQDYQTICRSLCERFHGFHNGLDLTGPAVTGFFQAATSCL